jgi:hypothetical protein
MNFPKNTIQQFLFTTYSPEVFSGKIILITVLWLGKNDNGY